uniref:Uncharacterized protein n=1 Tax=Setaria digitata TaxID=48799 RepID=A0A915PPZ5_9BILA
MQTIIAESNIRVKGHPSICHSGQQQDAVDLFIRWLLSINLNSISVYQLQIDEDIPEERNEIRTGTGKLHSTSIFPEHSFTASRLPVNIESRVSVCLRMYVCVCPYVCLYT